MEQEEILPRLLQEEQLVPERQRLEGGQALHPTHRHEQQSCCRLLREVRNFKNSADQGWIPGRITCKVSQLGTKAGIVGDKFEAAPKGKSGGGSGSAFTALLLLLLLVTDAAAAAAAAAAQRSFCRSANSERMPPPPPPLLAPFPPPPSLCLIGAGAASFDSPLGDFPVGGDGGSRERGRGEGAGEASREGEVERGLSTWFPPPSAFSRVTLPVPPLPFPPPSPISSSSSSSSSTISISAVEMDGFVDICFPGPGFKESVIVIRIVNI